MSNAALPIVAAMMDAARESMCILRAEVSNVRYGPLGYWCFEFRNKTYQMPEPRSGASVVLGIDSEIERRLVVRAILDKMVKVVDY